MNDTELIAKINQSYKNGDKMVVILNTVENIINRIMEGRNFFSVIGKYYDCGVKRKELDIAIMLVFKILDERYLSPEALQFKVKSFRETTEENHKKLDSLKETFLIEKKRVTGVDLR